MIINFKTLGGQGGGEYVLPTASSTTLGGVKIGSGISIDSDGKISADGSSYELPVASTSTLGGIKVGQNLSIDADGTLNAQGGGSDERLEDVESVTARALCELNSKVQNPTQSYFEIESEEDLINIENPKEGDIACIPESFITELDGEEIYDAINRGATIPQYLIDTLGAGAVIKVKIVDNPYYDGQSGLDMVYSYFQYYRETEEGGGTSGVGYENDAWRCSIGSYTWDYDWNPNTPYLIYNDRYGSVYTCDAHQTEYYWIRPENTTYAKALELSQIIPGKSFQYVNGAWIEFVTPSDIKEISQKINNVESSLGGKVDNSGYSISSWEEITYTSPFIGQISIGGADNGYRLHTPGAGTEFTNPRVDQITTSESVLRLKTLTQDEYDELVDGGQINSNTFYIIVEEE